MYLNQKNNTTTTTVLWTLYRSAWVGQHLQLRTGGFVHAKFYCLHALADGNQHIWIRENTVGFSSTVLSTLSPYLKIWPQEYNEMLKLLQENVAWEYDAIGTAAVPDTDPWQQAKPATAGPAALFLHNACPSQMPVSPWTQMGMEHHLQCNSNTYNTALASGIMECKSDVTTLSTTAQWTCIQQSCLTAQPWGVMEWTCSPTFASLPEVDADMTCPCSQSVIKPDSEVVVCWFAGICLQFNVALNSSKPIQVIQQWQ